LAENLRAGRYWVASHRPRPKLIANTSVTVAVLTVLYGPTARADDTTLEEVTVTATRRAVSAQDLPISISAVTGEALEQAGIGDIAGLAHSMAGVNFTDKGAFGGVNGATLIIRGLNSESTAGQGALATPVVPPVAIYVDDTPLFVNLRLQDLDHVEILRGPQGTLYGSGSLGGTIRFVQNAPNPNAFDAKVEVGASKTAHTHAPNEDVSAMVNLPISPTLAVRLNGSWTEEAGFINQPNLYKLDSSGAPVLANPGDPVSSPPVIYAKDGTNEYGYRSARIATLWKPGESFHAQLSYYHQISTAGGYGLSSLTSPDNTRATSNDKVDLVALALSGDLGFATVTLDSSWARHTNDSSTDETYLYQTFPFYSSFYGANPRADIVSHDRLDDRPWSEELRLVSPTGGMFDWLGGLYFKSQQTNIQQHDFYPGYLNYYNACSPIYGQSVGDGVTPSQCGIGETAFTPGSPPNVIAGIPIIQDQAYIGDFETRYKDLAAYGEATWHATARWSLTGGTRIFKQTVSQSQQAGLLFDGPIAIANESLSDSWRRALWKINVSFEIDSRNLAYATWSQGFRRGGVNALPPTEPAVAYVTPAALTRVKPDTADNYEIGVKGTVLERIRYSAAFFDILWHDLQQGATLTPLVVPGAINVGDAYSRGFEMELFARITEHLSGHLDYTYDQTKLTSISALALAGLSVPPPAVGAPLPGTPKTSAALGLEYGHLGLAGGELRCAVDARYQSVVVPALSATIPTVPGYIMVDARVSFTRANWVTTLHAENLTNNIGVNSYTDPFSYGRYYQALVSRPRTVGITVGYSFRGW
jgi:outer membrane receptor protein involved in Fe transport